MRLLLARPLLVAIAVAIADAELENHVFTSKPDHLQIIVPRGWRETDQASYPGLLLWMIRPEGRIVLSAEAFTHELYCSWPITCRTSHEITSMSAKLACAMRQKLIDQRMHVGPVQAGPRENEDAGLPSVWFEYDDGKHFLRQAVALGEDRAISLVLSAPSADSRSTEIRAFEQTLRTLRPLAAEQLLGSAGSADVSGAGSARQRRQRNDCRRCRRARDDVSAAAEAQPRRPLYAPMTCSGESRAPTTALIRSSSCEVSASRSASSSIGPMSRHP